ncbi:hypothetical protein AB5J52_04160 [Streptomyces sp. R39]|uniref:Uncharacterized protein n=1 Tax=Streptomyces sp. R39 TaxID=3238631 RepID=A0AB39QFV9_9ACTN
MPKYGIWLLEAAMTGTSSAVHDVTTRDVAALRRDAAFKCMAEAEAMRRWLMNTPAVTTRGGARS